MGIGNSTNAPDSSDIRPKMPQSFTSNHKGGRRTKTGKKESQLASARSTSLQHKHIFRSGAQDARTGGDKPGPVNTLPTAKRRGSGSPHMKPSAHS